MSWVEDLVEPLRADVTSGAAEIARRAARSVAGMMEAESYPAGLDPGEAGRRVALALVDAQPAMAPLLNLARVLLLELERPSHDDVDVRARLGGRARDFERSFEPRASAVAGHAAAVLKGQARVLTLSHSSTVRRALLETARRGALQVICLESRPENEGRSLAETLARAGVEVTYAVDAALETLLPSCDTVLLGTDSVGDAGYVNKIGSAAAARAARGLGIPTLVLADSTKLLPPGYPETPEAARPPDGVWQAPEGVTVWNGYFEVVPSAWIGSVVLEDGVWSARQIEERRSALTIPPALAQHLSRGAPQGPDSPQRKVKKLPSPPERHRPP